MTRPSHLHLRSRRVLGRALCLLGVPLAHAYLVGCAPAGVPPRPARAPLRVSPSLEPAIMAQSDRFSERDPQAAMARARRVDLMTPREGVASYYGGFFHGRRTANGERFNKRALTAAHRHLPFGTCVRVLHIESGRSVEVRINDRGPYARGRIIDLSEGAARRLGMKKEGVARVRLLKCEPA